MCIDSKNGIIILPKTHNFGKIQWSSRWQGKHLSHTSYVRSTVVSITYLYLAGI